MPPTLFASQGAIVKQPEHLIDDIEIFDELTMRDEVEPIVIDTTFPSALKILWARLKFYLTK